MAFLWDLPSGKRLQLAIENGPVEIVDLPIKSHKTMIIFHSYVGLPEGTLWIHGHCLLEATANRWAPPHDSKLYSSPTSFQKLRLDRDKKTKVNLELANIGYSTLW